MAKEQTGIAGEFWFFSQLHRLGYEAYITFGNTKGIDITVKLGAGRMLTFEVKSKLNFSGSFQYLNIARKKDHYVVFVDLAAIRHKGGKTDLLANPECYIVQSLDLDEIGFYWKPGPDSPFGFEAKLLWFLKYQRDTSITKKNISDFIKRHGISGGINFKKYNKIIWSLSEFEDNYYSFK